MITVGTDTYISLADAQAYATSFGLALGATDTATETLLKRATAAIDRHYGNRFLGVRSTMTQQLAWPRSHAAANTHSTGESGWVSRDSDNNPRDFSGLQPETGWATVELAAQLQAGADPYTQPEASLVRLTQKVSSLEETREYAGAQGHRTDALYKISLILRPLLRNTTGSIGLARGA